MTDMEKEIDLEEVKAAVETLKAGGIILYPTDTVWGIGCDATNEAAVAKVFEIKQRSDSKSLITSSPYSSPSSSPSSP